MVRSVVDRSLIFFVRVLPPLPLGSPMEHSLLLLTGDISGLFGSGSEGMRLELVNEEAGGGRGGGGGGGDLLINSFGPSAFLWLWWEYEQERQEWRKRNNLSTLTIY